MGSARNIYLVLVSSLFRLLKGPPSRSRILFYYYWSDLYETSHAYVELNFRNIFNCSWILLDSFLAIKRRLQIHGFESVTGWTRVNEVNFFCRGTVWGWNKNVKKVYPIQVGSYILCRWMTAKFFKLVINLWFSLLFFLTQWFFLPLLWII